MLKKIILQVFLLIFIFTISVIFFKTYFKKEDKIEKIQTKENEANKTKDESNKSKGNLIYDVVYKSNNESGNNYVILSEISELPKKDSDLVLMKGVEATVNIKNSSPITIFSDKAVFNKATYDTDFSENVLIIYDDHYITSNNLDLFFQKNLAIISNEIVYKNLNTTLQADMIEINMLSKKSKIFMKDKKRKIKISTSN